MPNKHNLVQELSEPALCDVRLKFGMILLDVCTYDISLEASLKGLKWQFLVDFCKKMADLA